MRVKLTDRSLLSNGGLLAGLTVLAVAAATPAHAQEMQRYVVREGESCSSIARRLYGSSRRYDYIHEHNPDLGAMPHRLEAGTVLNLPVVEQTAADATVTAVQRAVGSQPPQASNWGRARVGQELEQGWRVNTEERSRAELSFRGSSVAQVREQTLVIIYGTGVRRVRREGARAVLMEGGLLSRISALSGDQPLEVETPASLATLRTGEASVDVESDGVTRVAVHSGEAATVTRLNGSGSVSVPAGTGTRVRRGRPPSRPRPLPRAPRWTSGQPDTFISLGDRGGTLRGGWEAAPDANRYRVEIARRRDGRELIVSTEVAADVRQLEIHRLPPGTYFARVVTIDSELFEGRPGRPTELTVHGVDLRYAGAAEFTGVRPADPFGLDTLDSEILPEDELAADAPSTRQLPLGTTVRLPESMRCTVEGAAVQGEQTLETPGEVAFDCEGSVSDFSVEVMPIAAEIFADDGESPPALAAQGESALRVRLEGLDDVSGLVVEGPGVRVVSAESVGPGELRVRLSREDEGSAAQSATPLSVRSPQGVTLTTVEVPVTPQATEATPAPAFEERELAPPYRTVHESFGLPLYASTVGLVDERRRGSGMYLATSVTSAESGDIDPGVRITGGLRAALFEDRLRVDLGVPGDALGAPTRTSQRGSRDLFVAVSSLILDGALDSDLSGGLAAEVGLFTPTAGADGLDRARLRVAVDASLRVLEERLTLRTRQAGIFDLVEDGSLLWASAYGGDVWIAGPFGLGAEVSLVMGHEDQQDVIAAAAGLASHLDFGPIAVSLAGRVGFGDTQLIPLMTLSLAVRGTIDFGAPQ